MRLKAPIIIAKLDRLSCDIHFISGLMSHQTHLHRCRARCPCQSPFMLHLYAALAEKERRLISQRTKEALAAKKGPGRFAKRWSTTLG